MILRFQDFSTRYHIELYIVLSMIIVIYTRIIKERK